MSLKRLQDLELDGRRVLVRVDFNVPLDDELRVTSDARIRAALPTIRAVLERGGRPVLMSHLGRPKGRVVESMRLAPAAARLADLLGSEVRTTTDCIGAEAERAAAELAAGQVLVLENLRFHAEEERGDPGFAAALAHLGDVYVNDAFGAAHRAHASIVGVAELLPSGAGLLLQSEVDAFDKLLAKPERPFVAILGGAKVSDKLPVMQHLVDVVDTLLVGGAMAYTFLAADGVDIGNSRFEPDLIEAARDIEGRCAAAGVELLLPIDHVCATALAADADVEISGPGIPAGMLGLDIGPATDARFRAAIGAARTIVWNGPMGVFEIEAFRAGTEGVAHAVADSAAYSVVGGGDSVAAIELLGLADRIDHVSTGGGASLELLEGRVLPGIAALQR